MQVTAGLSASVVVNTLEDSCYVDGPCGYAEVTASDWWISPMAAVDHRWWSPSLDTIPTAQGGSYWYAVDLCNYSWILEGYNCVSAAADVEVDAPTPPPPTARVSFGGIDVTSSSANVVVGQRISLMGVVNNLPAGVTVVKNSWTIGGTKIAAYTLSDDAGTKTDFSDAGPFTQSVVFYWVAGGSNNVVYTATLSNGGTYTGTATFSVSRPTASMQAAVTSQPPSIHSCEQPAPLVGICLGYPENDQPGITFNFSVSSAVEGDIGIVQLVDSTRTQVRAGQTYITTTGGTPAGDTRVGSGGFLAQDEPINDENVYYMHILAGQPISSAPSGAAAYDDSPGIGLPL